MSRQHDKSDSARYEMLATPAQQSRPGSSASMVRKRTLDVMGDDASSSSSSPYSNLPSFEFDAIDHRDNSSPYSATTSPMMALSNSSQSSFGGTSSFSAFGGSTRSAYASSSHDGDCGDDDADHGDEDDDGLLAPPVERPGLKRRKTAPEICSSPITPTRGDGADRRGGGKDGENVWPSDVEDAFHTALQIIPKLGRKKIVVSGKACGRNELIADYIRRKTGQIRSRKQVSSHIQVLKNMRKHDAEFMALVSEPLEGEDTFAPAAAKAFFGMEDSSDDVHLKAPQSAALKRTWSADSAPRSGLMSRTMSTDSTYAQSQPMSATSSLTTALNDLHFPMPPLHSPHLPSPPNCPILPADFALWADEAEAEATHTFARFARPDSAPVGEVHLDTLSTQSREYPGLERMWQALPCQFLHTSVNLEMPKNDAGRLSGTVNTNLRLTSLQALSLTCVTRIYSYGHEVLSLQEQLDMPTLLQSSSERPSSSSSSASSGSASHALGHQFAFRAPFAGDFWSVFLHGAFTTAGTEQPSTFAKTGAELDAFEAAIAGLAVIQEFVVCPTVPTLRDPRTAVSPGSAIGDVVLVVTYDFKCNDHKSSSTGTSTLSYLAGPQNAAPPVALAQPTTTRIQPQALLSARSQPQVAAASPSKPNLTLRVPPPEVFEAASLHQQSLIGAQPLTPWSQMSHTPSFPPPIMPIGQPIEPRDQRLERLWARDSNTWALASPALMGAFPVHPAHLLYGQLPAGSQAPMFHHPPSTQALHGITRDAIEAGTPTLATFPGRLVHDAPFVHPSHGIQPESLNARRTSAASSSSSTSSQMLGRARSTERSSRVSARSTLSRSASPSSSSGSNDSSSGEPTITLNVEPILAKSSASAYSKPTSDRERQRPHEAEQRTPGRSKEPTTRQPLSPEEQQNFFSTLLGSSTRYAPGASSTRSPSTFFDSPSAASRSPVS